MIENDNEEILSDIAWAFSYASDDGGDERIAEFIRCNAVPRLIQMLHTLALPYLSHASAH